MSEFFCYPPVVARVSLFASGITLEQGGDWLMRKILIASAMATLVATPACSNRQVYDAVQQNQQLECQKLQGSQYEECMEQLSEPYDSYKSSRDELLKDSQS